MFYFDASVAQIIELVYESDDTYTFIDSGCHPSLSLRMTDGR